MRTFARLGNAAAEAFSLGLHNVAINAFEVA
jgi:hypothetical protein